MLSCQGVPVITDEELDELNRLLIPTSSPTLRLMLADGATVAPDAAFRLLDLDLRIAALGNDRAHDLLDQGLARLAGAFPGALQQLA